MCKLFCYENGENYFNEEIMLGVVINLTLSQRTNYIELSHLDMLLKNFDLCKSSIDSFECFMRRLNIYKEIEM